MEAWVSSGLPWGQGHWLQQSWEVQDHDVSRRETGRKPAQFLLGLYKQSISGSREHMTDHSHKSRVTAPQWIPRLGAVYRPGTPEWREARSQHITEIYQVRFSPSFLPSLDHCTLGKREQLDLLRLLDTGSGLIPGDSRCHHGSPIRLGFMEVRWSTEL